MANALGICLGVGLLLLIIGACIISYWRLIVYRRNLRRRYGRRAGEEPPHWWYDALPMCFGNPNHPDDGGCQPCPWFMKHEPDPDAPPAAALMEAKTDDTSRVPDIGNQPPPTYDDTVTDGNVTSDDVTKENSIPKPDGTSADLPPPNYDQIVQADVTVKPDEKSLPEEGK